MSAERGSLLVSAPRGVVRDILLQPLAMPHWNPAFRAMEGPVEPSVDVSYALRTVHGLSGSLWYSAICDDRIDMSWTVPGFTEHGAWELHEAMYGTSVTHRFEHSGPLAALLRAAYRGVADLRLQRLAKRATAALTAGPGAR